MTRIVSTNFRGVLVRDVMRGALVHGQRWLRACIGDTALTADRIGGLNGATAITHTGAPNGCPPGMPLWCQGIPGRSTTPAGAGSLYYVICIPFYVADGEDDREWIIDVDCSEDFPGSYQTVAEVRDASFTLEHSISMVAATGRWSDGSTTYRATCPELSNAWHYLAIMRALDPDDTDSAIMGGRMYPSVMQSPRAVGIPAPDSTAVGDPFAAIASFAPSAVTDFQDEEIFAVSSSATADVGVNGWAMTKLTKLQNSLWEWITGARIPGNRTRQVTPIRTHDKSVFTNEGEVPLPVVSIAVGATFRDPSSKSIASDLSDWCRVPTHDVGSPSTITVSKAIVRMPDFDDGSSSMVCKVIAGKESGTATRWEFRVTSSAGSSSWVALSSLDTVFFAANITAVPFTAGADNEFELQCRHTVGGGGATSDSIAITGWSIAHIP